jgi:Concanavalin A-like lectin/glucanases superfamily
MPPVYPPGSYPAQVVADGAVAYWRLGETSGAMIDVIGGKNGTVTGTPILGISGALADGDKAIDLNGTTTIDTAAVANTAAFTIEVWLKLVVSEYVDAVFYGTTTTAGNWVVQCSGTHVYTYYYGASSGPSIPNPPFNQWHHYVFVTDGTTASSYLDGQPVGTPLARAHPAPTAAPLHMGSALGPTRFAHGGLDEVALYNTALTAPQIAAHYAARTWTAAVETIQTLIWMPV